MTETLNQQLGGKLTISSLIAIRQQIPQQGNVLDIKERELLLERTYYFHLMQLLSSYQRDTQISSANDEQSDLQCQFALFHFEGQNLQPMSLTHKDDVNCSFLPINKSNSDLILHKLILQTPPKSQSIVPGTSPKSQFKKRIRYAQFRLQSEPQK